MLCHALARLGTPDGESTYLRLSTRPIDQAGFGAAIDRYGETRLRDHVLAGGYRLVEYVERDRPGVTIATTGAVVPEAMAAAEELHWEGVNAVVVNITSPDLLYRSWQQRFRGALQGGAVVRRSSHLHALIPAGERRNPIVSVHDAASHSLAWLGSALGAPQVALGVDRFGESGTIADLHDIMGISYQNIVNAALISVHEDASE